MFQNSLTYNGDNMKTGDVFREVKFITDNGSVIELDNEFNLYMLAQTTWGGVSLISLYNGNRYRPAYQVKNLSELSSDEIDVIFGNIECWEKVDVNLMELINKNGV